MCFYLSTGESLMKVRGGSGYDPWVSPSRNALPPLFHDGSHFDTINKMVRYEEGTFILLQEITVNGTLE